MGRPNARWRTLLLLTLLLLSPQTGWPAPPATQKMALGKKLAAEKRLPEALDAYLDAALLFEKNDQDKKRFNALVQAGLLQSRLKRPEAALKSLGKALETAERLAGRNILYHQALLHRGRVLKRGGRHEKARTDLQQAARGLAKKPLWAAPAHRDLGRVLAVLKKPDEAVAAFRQAFDIYAAQGKKRVMHAFATLKEAGNLRLKAGEAKKALPLFREAAAFANKAWGEKAGYHQAQVLASRSLQALNRHDEALPGLEAALAFHRLEKNDAWIAGLARRIGLLHMRRARAEPAKKALKLAAATYRKLGKEALEARAISYLGQVEYRYGGIQAALDLYLKALAIHRRLGADDQVARNLNLAGLALNTQDRYAEAEKFHQEALEIGRRLKRDDIVSMSFNNLALVYDDRGESRLALAAMKASLEAARKSTPEAHLGERLYNLAGMHEAVGEYEESARLVREALDNALKHDQLGDIAHGYRNLAISHLQRSQRIDALDYLKKALAMEKKLGREKWQALNLEIMGDVYQHWGEFNKALGLTRQALAIRQKRRERSKTADLLSDMGSLHASLGQLEKAARAHQEALAIYEGLMMQRKTAHSLSSLGGIFRRWGRYEQALAHVERALAIHRKADRPPDIASELGLLASLQKSLNRKKEAKASYEEAIALKTRLKDDVGLAYSKRGLAGLLWGSAKPERILDLYQGALMVFRRIDDPVQVESTLVKMGLYKTTLKRYPEAIGHFREAVAIVNRLRKKAPPEARLDYRAQNEINYGLLIEALIDDGRQNAAFDAAEESRAQDLAERLVERGALNITPIKADVLTKIQEPATAVLAYAYAHGRNVVKMISMRGGVFSWMAGTDALLAKAEKEAGPLTEAGDSAAAVREESRGLARRAKGTSEEWGSVMETPPLERIIQRYRELLLDPDAAPAREALSRLLYDYFIKPVEKNLAKRKTLIIVPNGALGLLPFETLMDAEGTYLAETHKIIYVHSLTALSMLKERYHPDNRKPMLALGGAVYNKENYATEMAPREIEWTRLAKNATRSINAGASLAASYVAMGRERWSNLPGSLQEVNKIAERIPDARLLTGEAVSEARLKAMSDSGELAGYQALHFATHGLTVPAVPDLSALVLSQSGKATAGEDGYLHRKEIEALKLKADFVNLSACDTGVGKIYKGEGVVGLAQAFLTAGANALSVSLWPVSDISTTRFMDAFYQRTQKGMRYAEALAEVKRRFIKGEFGEEYKNPYYWAPFVYYGKP